MTKSNKKILAYSLLALAASVTINATIISARSSFPTTNEPPTGALEDPNNSETTSETDNTSPDDDLCNRCYDHIQTTQAYIAQHANLITRQKQLIRRRNKQLSSNNINNNSTRSTRRSSHSEAQQAQSGHSNSTPTTRSLSASMRSRTLANEPESNSIIVSRLRVARSPIDQFYKNPKVSGNSANPKTPKDRDLEQLRMELKQLLNSTCKSLNLVQECLDGLSQECTGNLQFHSFDVYSSQWHSRLNCPYRNNPNIKPFRNLRSAWEIPEPTEKTPVVRPISSDEEVRKRLDKMFPSQNRGPLGVMLKPTLTYSGHQKFNSISDRQQILQSHEGVRIYGPPGVRNMFASASSQNEIDNQILIHNVGLYMIPCFMALIIAFILLIAIHLRKSQNDYVDV